MASHVWLQPSGLYSSVAEAARLVAKSGLMVVCFAVVMASKCVLVIFLKSNFEILCCVCSFLKMSLYYYYFLIIVCQQILREMVGVPYVLSLSSSSPGPVVTISHGLSLQQVREGVPCPSVGSGAGDLHEPMLPSPASSPFPFRVFGCRPVMLVSPSFCSLLIPAQVSWDNRISAPQKNMHFLPVLPSVMNFLFPLVRLMRNTILERFGSVYPRVILWLSITRSYTLWIFQMRWRVFKCGERVKHLWSWGSINPPSAPNLGLAVSPCNKSTLLNIEITNCFLYFQKNFNIGEFTRVALQLRPAGSTFTWTTTTAGNCNRTVPVKTRKIYYAGG